MVSVVMCQLGVFSPSSEDPSIFPVPQTLHYINNVTNFSFILEVIVVDITINMVVVTSVQTITTTEEGSKNSAGKPSHVTSFLSLYLISKI
jgi:hypothetical protein